MHKIRTLRFVAIMVASLLGVANMSAQPFGLWNFDAGNLTATVGADLSALDGNTTANTSFGSTTGLGISNINGSPANVMRFLGSTNAGMGFSMVTPAANGGGVNVDNYTMIFDVLYVATDDGKVRPFLQTDGGFVTPAADFAVSAGGQVGSPGVGFGGAVTTNTWYRIGFVVRTNEVRTFIDGALIDTLNGAINRFPLFPGPGPLGVAELLGNRVSGTAGGGYFNSIQLREVALDDREMRAMGKASATGIPQTIPPVPSFIVNWTPPAAVANRSTLVGVVIDQGDTTIALNSISMKFDGVALPNVTKSQVGDVITVSTNMGTLALGQHTLEVTYTDDAIVGAQTYSTLFTAVVFYEDFDGLTLGVNVQEALPDVIEKAWTDTPPAGWTVDDTGIPGNGNSALNGVDEWAGWSFASRAFWFAADTQNRELFEKAKGTVAIADPDEWDDNEGGGGDHAVGYFNAIMKTPAISLTGVPANSVFIKFDSSWRPEAQDDCGGTEWPACPALNNQTATIRVSYDNGATWLNKLTWDSIGSSPTFHPDSENETVTIVINNPSGVTSVIIEFGLLNAGNDWWWAFDNLQVGAGPAITTQPVSLIRDAGSSSSFTVVAAGSGTVTYKWQFNGGSGSVYTDVPGATSASYNFTAEPALAGSYRVIVTDAVGTTTSSLATLTVIAAPLPTQQPVARTVNAGANVGFSVAARGRAPITYAWAKGGVAIGGQTATSLAINNAQAANAGLYTCVVSNPDGVVTSSVAGLKIVSSITEDLVVHLKFDGDYTDSSVRGNNATAVGAPVFVAGKIGSGMEFTTAKDGSSFNYATLGLPADLHFTEGSPFSLAFWIKLTPLNRAGDPALIGNKNWNSGGNAGFVIFTTGPLRWNYRELDVTDPNPLLSKLNARYDGNAGGTVEDGNWHHCVVTVNRGGNIGTYVDGQLKLVTSIRTANATLGGFYAPTTIDNDPVNARSGGANAFNIGQDGTGTYTDGGGVGITNAVMDDVGIWRRTLTPGEVLAIYTAGNAGNPLNAAAPVTDPTPLDPSIALAGTTIEVTKANTMLLSAPAVTGPWTEVTGARGTNVWKEPAASQKYYRGSQP